MKKMLSVGTLLSALILTGCNVSEKQIEEALVKNPDIIVKVIEANPGKIMGALQNAAGKAREELAKQREEEESKRFEESFSNPLVPKIREDETVRGTKGAPIVIVEYSDFQCPFCTRGFQTVKELLNKYEGKVQFIYKHLPLSFHKQAMIAAQYYEAIRLQNAQKAFDFHDEVFAQQQKLQLGESFLDKIAKKVGADMTKLKKDVNSESVMKRIQEDQEEAAEFGMQGTPGFLVNGVPVRGAYPVDHFEKIISKLQEMGKIKI